MMNEMERLIPARGWKMLVALTLVGAAAIHVAVTPQHFDEWFAAGVFFVVLAVAEAVSGAVMASRVGERPAARGLVAALSAGTIALWVVSRTVGLPFGPDPGMPEAIGVLDVTSTALEALTLVALWALVRTPARATVVTSEPDADRVRRDRAA
jgi:hypothetical protein